MQTQQRSRAGVGTGRRVLAYLALVLGGLGIVVSLVGVFGTWFGRSAVDGLSLDLTTRVDSGLQQVDDRLTGALDRLEQTRGQLQGYQANAAQLGSGEAGRAAAAELGAALDRELGPPITALREAYIAARERVAASIELLAALDRVPFVTVPDLPTEQLVALDTRVRGVDDTLRDTRSSLDDQGLPLGALGTRIGEGIGRLDTAIGELETGFQTADSELERARDAVAGVHATVTQTTMLLAIALTLLLLWNALLHLLLLLRGRAWLGGDPAW